MKNYKFPLFVDCSHLCFDLVLARFCFSLFTFIKYYIYSRLLYFMPGWNIFNPEWSSSNNFNVIWNFSNVLHSNIYFIQHRSSPKLLTLHEISYNSLRSFGAVWRNEPVYLGEPVRTSVNQSFIDKEVYYFTEPIGGTV